MIWLMLFFSSSAFSNESLRDLKPFYLDLDWFRVSISLVFLLVGLFLIFKKLIKKFKKKKIEKILTPIEKALKQIDNLPVGSLKQQTFEISMIIRRLFDSMFISLSLCEKTTKEIRAQKESIVSICGEERVDELIRFLQVCDEIKYRPSSSNDPLQELKNIALDIIEKLKQKEKDV